jgi:hypothetical protein
MKGGKAGLSRLGTHKERFFRQKYEKSKKEIKAVRMILNKIARFQSEGLKFGGRIATGKIKIEQIPQRIAEEILRD